MSEVSDSERVLELLGDEYVQEILKATSDRAMSAKQLSEHCDVDVSTVYRRADDLLDQNLLVEKTKVEPDGSHHSIYETNIDHLELDVRDGRFDVDLEVRESPAERFTRMWDDIRST